MRAPDSAMCRIGRGLVGNLNMAGGMTAGSHTLILACWGMDNTGGPGGNDSPPTVCSPYVWRQAA